MLLLLLPVKANGRGWLRRRHGHANRCDDEFVFGAMESPAALSDVGEMHVISISMYPIGSLTHACLWHRKPQPHTGGRADARALPADRSMFFCSKGGHQLTPPLLMFGDNVLPITRTEPPLIPSSLPLPVPLLLLPVTPTGSDFQ